MKRFSVMLLTLSATFVYSALDQRWGKSLPPAARAWRLIDALVSRSRDGAAKFYDEDCIFSLCALDSAWHLGTLTLLGSKVFLWGDYLPLQ